MCCVKDARSVSLYPYTWSQLLQYVKYTSIRDKLTLPKGIAKTYVNNVYFWTNKVKLQQQQNKKATIIILARAGNRTRDLMHRSLER